MIDESRCKDEEGLDLFKEALRDLLILVPLAGFSLLGESITILEDSSIGTLRTDGRKIWYSPKWMRAKDLKNRIWDILHEWLHIFLNHCARCGDRDQERWNIAVDIVVLRECSKLLGNGFSVPEDGVQIPAWAGEKTAEEIYDLLKEKSARIGTLPGLPSAGDLLFDEASEYSKEEEEEFFYGFREELAQAKAVMEKANPASIPDSIRSRLDEILKDTIDWGRLINGDLLAEFGGPIPTFSPPNRRLLGWFRTNTGAPLILPSFRSTKEKTLMLGVDVSTSMGPTLMNRVISNVMPAACRAATTHVVTFDQTIREHVRTTNPRRILEQVKFESGSHAYTDVRPVFDLVDKIRPTALTILTDAFLEYPEQRYDQTLWVTPMNAGTPPWGRVYTMKESW